MAHTILIIEDEIELAEILGVSKSTYGRWETDEAIIPLFHLNNLCNYFVTTFFSAGALHCASLPSAVS